MVGANTVGADRLGYRPPWGRYLGYLGVGAVLRQTCVNLNQSNSVEGRKLFITHAPFSTLHCTDKLHDVHPTRSPYRNALLDCTGNNGTHHGTPAKMKGLLAESNFGAP